MVTFIFACSLHPPYFRPSSSCFFQLPPSPILDRLSLLYLSFVSFLFFLSHPSTYTHTLAHSHSLSAMRFVLFLTFLTLLAWNVQAGIITSTYSWYQGNTILVSVTTSPNGATEAVVLSTLTAGATDATSTKTTTTKKATTTATAATKTAATTTSGTTTKTTTSATIATTVLTASGVTVTIESGTTLDYAGFSSIVAPSLEAAYSATASSASSRQLALTSLPVVFVSLTILGGAFGGIGLLL